MEIKNDNPAGRLYSLLVKAKSVDKNKTMKEVWKDCCHSPFISEYDLLKRRIQLYDLTLEIKNLIKSIDGINADLYLKYYYNIEAITSIDNGDKVWQELIDKLDDATMDSLAHCADILSQHFGEIVLTSGEVHKLSYELDILIKKIEESNIDSRLKIVILQQLKRIKTALEGYLVTGTKEIILSLSSSYGIFADNSDFMAEKEREEVKSVLQYLSDVGKKVLRTAEVLKLAYDIGVIVGFLDPTLLHLLPSCTLPQIPHTPKLLPHTPGDIFDV